MILISWESIRFTTTRYAHRNSGLKPLFATADLHAQNFAMMSEYVTDMGRIKHSNETGLRPRNQRRMAKAIRRAIGTGMMPGVYRHPEILRVEMKDRRSL